MVGNFSPSQLGAEKLACLDKKSFWIISKGKNFRGKTEKKIISLLYIGGAPYVGSGSPSPPSISLLKP